MRVCGKNVFNETDPKTIRRVLISPNFRDQEIMQKIRENKIKYVETDQRDLDRMLPHNQGIVFDINDYEYYELSSIEDNENMVVILDHLEDPHNFGAIIRTCEARGINTIIVKTHPTWLKEGYEEESIRKIIDLVLDFSAFLEI